MHESLTHKTLASPDRLPARLVGRTERRFRRLDRIVRRLLDIAASLVGLCLLAPIFAYVAWIIKRDSPGPVFYWGPRVGRGGREFNILKFRTMYEKAESYRGPKVTGANDSRITPIGGWLRDTKLNELPQLWNVLKGEMSLVGPRPEDPAFVAHWPAEARKVLLSVRPGVTSPASVLYRDEESLLQGQSVINDYLRQILPSKLRLDTLYVRHRSCLTDLDVIFWTIIALLPRLTRHEVTTHLLFWGPLSRFFSRYLSWFVVDNVVALAAVVLAGLIWRSEAPLHVGAGKALAVALTMALVFSVVNTLLGLNRVYWSKASAGSAFDLALSTLLATIAILLANYLLALQLPPLLILLSGGLAFAGFVTVRYRSRLLTGLATRWTNRRGARALGERVLIVGAGEVGEFAHWLLQTGKLAYAFGVVGVVDDAPHKQGTQIDGMRVLGTVADIPRLVAEHDIGLLLFAIEQIDETERRDILQICYSTPAHTVLVPDTLRLLRQQFTAHIDESAYLQRPGQPGIDPHCVQSWLAELEALIDSRAWDKAAARLQDMKAALPGNE
jgi:lipopolysaccharide/colanic/teichoic acid biosynthesis glycosyltransferase